MSWYLAREYDISLQVQVMARVRARSNTRINLVRATLPHQTIPNFTMRYRSHYAVRTASGVDFLMMRSPWYK